MNQVAHIRTAGSLTDAQIALVKRTVAKDCNPDEFNLFMAAASRAGLDPLRKQISAIVFSKGNADKRQLAIITTIDGLRVIAARQGDYRPMETPPVIEYSEDAKDPATNPLGIVSCEVRCWKKYGSEWHPVAGVAYWDEFVPLEQEWAYDPEQGKRAPSGNKVLKDGSPWRRMPRVMIAKVAEAQALRRGWPDDMAGLYGEEEMQRAQVIDVASEVVEEYEERQRIERVNPKEAALFVFEAGGVLERVDRGHIADRLMAHYRKLDDPQALIDFRDRNAESLKTFWAWSPGDALAVKKFAEQRLAELIEAKKDKRADDAAPTVEDAGGTAEAGIVGAAPGGDPTPPASSSPPPLSMGEIIALKKEIKGLIADAESLADLKGIKELLKDQLARAPAEISTRTDELIAEASKRFAVRK